MASDSDMTGRTAGVGSKSGIAIVTGTAVKSVVEGLHDKIIGLLGGAGLHDKQVVVARFAVKSDIRRMVLVLENDGFNRFGPDNGIFRLTMVSNLFSNP